VPTDPILIPVDAEFSTLPPDIKAWFGPTKKHKVMISLVYIPFLAFHVNVLIFQSLLYEQVY
jgi:hypothetical protein